MTKLLSFKSLRKKLDDRSRSACYIDIETGRLPKPIKIGRNLYWEENLVDTFLAELREASHD